MFQERPYQEQAIEADITEYDKGVRRMLNVMATGTGKTIVFSKLYEKLKSRLPGQMLVIAHTEELVKQNADKMQKVNPSIKVDIEMGEKYADPNADVVSASVQTLGRLNSSRALRFNWTNIDKVVVDEAHHSVNDAYGRVLALAGSMSEGTHKFLLGTTATSQRPDGKALSDVYEKVAFVYGLRQAVADKWLVPIRAYRVTTNTVLDGVESSHGDFKLSALSTAVDTQDRNRRIVEAWKKLASSRKTVAFCCDIEHAQHLAKEFTEAGIPACAIWGDDPDRESKLERHRNGEIRVLCNCSVLVEGYDDPSISCVLLCRPTRSQLLLAQMVGRGTRLAAGKHDLVAVDFVDAAAVGIVTLPTLMGLSSLLDLKGHDLLTSVEEMEAVLEEHPTLNLTTLDDIEKLQSVVQAIDLMQVRFPNEVETNSDLIWFRAVDGGYKIAIPKDGPEKAGFMHIRENLLGQWEINGRIKDDELFATRTTMEDAFKASDEQIRTRLGKMRLSYLLREATWHAKPVTTGQRKMLERLFPWRQFPWPQITSGMASKMIAERLNKK